MAFCCITSCLTEIYDACCVLVLGNILNSDICFMSSAFSFSDNVRKSHKNKKKALRKRMTAFWEITKK